MRDALPLVSCLFLISCATLDDESTYSAVFDGHERSMEAESEPIVLEEQPWDVEPPEFLHDVNGWTWVRSHKIEYSNAPSVEPEAVEEMDERGLEPEPDPFKVSDYEYGYYFRPLADIGGWEYHLDDESIESLGARMRYREAARREGRKDIPSLYEGQGASVGFSEDRSSMHSVDSLMASAPDITTSAKIIGADDRISLDAWAGVYPANIHGALVDVIPYASWCTAFKAVNHYSAATAAHCLYDPGNKTWLERKGVQFQAGLLHGNASKVPPVVPSGCYTRIISANYSSNSNLAKNDYAVLVFNGNGSAYCAQDTYNFGYVGWKSVGVGVDFASHIWGYPSENPLPIGWPSYLSLSYSFMNDGIGQTIFQPNVTRHKHDTTGGQSGTALLSFSSTQGYQARAIHKGGGAGDYNRGREFNGTVADWINSYIGD